MAGALTDAHQPSYDVVNGTRALNLERSIENVVRSSLLALAVG
jgi:hypothetical protein